MPKIPSVAIIVLAGLSSALVACTSDGTPGAALPAVTPSSASASSGSVTSTATSGEPPSNGSLSTTSPCDLLPEPDRAMLGVTSTRNPEQVGTAMVCDFRTTTGTAGIAIRTDVGLAGVVVNGPISDVVVGSHQARQMRDQTGGCQVFVGVSPMSRVDVSVVNRRSDQDVACVEVLKFAKAVEPHLPAS